MKNMQMNPQETGTTNYHCFSSVLSKVLHFGKSSCKHSHKKQKDSLETQAVLLMFSLELEISGVAVQSIHQNSEKWRLL